MKALIFHQKNVLLSLGAFWFSWGSSKDGFFGLFELEDSTAELIYSKTIENLKLYNIPIQNMIGFASDNPGVMTFLFSGVASRLKNINPNILTIGCTSTCHNFSLWSAHAVKRIPGQIEGNKHIKTLYIYFCHSSKNQKDFITFQKPLEVNEYQILKVCQTRWCLLEMILNRIIEQWIPLFNFLYTALIWRIYL